MSAFTRIGCGIWDWEPWTELGASARILWLALYSSAEAKRHVPGLWQGGIPSMADAARMAPDDVIQALDQLLEREMVEYDPKFRVLRLCELPDAGEYPSSGKVILGWWTKFKTVPVCPVRDAHVKTIAWIMDAGSKASNKAVTPHHQEAWTATFATIVVPAPRRRGVRRLADNDTGTSAQPSLFPSASSMPSGISPASSGEAGYPHDHRHAVDNSAVLRQLNNISSPETVSDTVSDTVSYTNRIPDPGSRIPDLSSLSGEGGWGGGHDSGTRPVLTLVPAYTAQDVIHELAKGPWDSAFDRTHQDALGALIAGWVAARVALADFRVLAQYNAFSGTRMNARVLTGCDVPAQVAHAAKVIQERDDRLSMLREFQVTP